MDNDGLTQYTRIAISLAERIASDTWKEGDKISGRSKLSPEYNVSWKTIRRALRLLADMRRWWRSGAERRIRSVRRQCPALSPQLEEKPICAANSSAAKSPTGPSGVR